MEKVIRSLAGLRDPRAFEAWIWTIARNTLAGHMRRRRREPTEPATPAGMEPADIVELAEEHSLIRAALEKLPMRDRQLLWLREVERLTHAEIGGWLGAATGAVRVALVHRARRRLEQAYDEISQENVGGEPMKTTQGQKRREQGASLVEFAVILPLLVMLIFGVIEASWAFAQHNDVRHGAREGARLSAVDHGTLPQIGQEVCDRMDLV